MPRNELRRYDPASPARLLKHVLENPGLVAAVRELPPAALGKLIERVGLEDSGELVALATTEQLERIFDEDLWRSDQVGQDPNFDAARFALWLEVLLESGEQPVVERLCELPLDFVVLAVHRLVLVVDIDALAVELAEGGEELDQVEKALDSCLGEEWEEFRVIARDGAAWDAIFSVLMALDRDHHDLLRAILERCCFLSSEYVEENGGLYEVLTSDEMLEVDAGAARDERRAAAGYVAPSDAKSFLELAKRGLGPASERDPATRAYFRELSRSGKAATPSPPASPAAAGLMRLLAEAEVFDQPPSEGRRRSKALPSSSTALEPDRGRDAQTNTLLDKVLSDLREHDPAAYAKRLEELVYLANVLVAGWAPSNRRFRPVEALEIAIAVCNQGLLSALAEKRAAPEAARQFVAKTPLDLLFRTAWRHEYGTGNRQWK
jgi:hypothetical protein